MASPFDLAGRVAIITGGNGGIGYGMAQGLAEAGASLVIAARDEGKSRATVEALSKIGPRVVALSVDVQSKPSVDAMVERTLEHFGRVDVLVTNAGVNLRKPPEQYSPDEWGLVLDVNLRGTFFCAQSVHAPMKRQGGGKIITIGSMTSIFGASFAAPYSASKGGTVQLTRALATAWAKDNIQVNAVLPGWIDTDLTRRARQEVQGLHERVVARTPHGRWGAPEDLSGIGVFLASRASDFITGTAIPVDGGYSAQA
jgi:2-deoxy-D-gluconate 3-dehydrogenase